MGEKLVSIIVPVYNNEDYLSKCLDSIINQTYKNIEIILVDDGSEDKSGTICDEYQNKDSRVKVYHCENRGASLAREFGLSVSSGDYVQFCDSDDWIDLEMTKKMLKSAETYDSDIVWCDIMMVEKNGYRVFKLDYDSSSTEMLKKLYRGRIAGWLPNKLIKKSILKDIKFPTDWMMEDVFISTQFLLKNEKNSYVNEPLYSYNQLNINAATKQSKGEEVVIKAAPNIENCYQFLINKDVLGLFEEDFSCMAMRLKIAILKTNGITDAKMIYPFAHKHLASYGLNPPISYLYWFGFNFGKIGELLLSLYLKRKS